MADETPKTSATVAEPVEPDSTSHGVDALEAAHKKPPKTYEKRKISSTETSQNDVTSSPCSETTSPATTSSPQNTSRYGRARKPKITEDFYNTEDIFGPYERIPASPIRSKKKQPLKLELTPNKSNDVVTTLDVADTIKPDLSMLAINIPEEQFEVSKVMKIVSNNTSDEFSPKSPSFTKPVKTYSGKREKQNSESIYESFGLPDYPSGENCPYVNGLSHSEDSASDNENTEKSTNTTSSSTASTTSKEIKRTKFNLLSLKKNTKSPVKQLIQSDNISTSTPAIKSDVTTINKKKLLAKRKIKVSAKIMKNKFRLQKKAVPVSRLKAKKLKPSLKKVRAHKVNLSEDSSENTSKTDAAANRKIEKIDAIDVFGKKLTHFYHVNFFGDNGRRSWVLQTHIFPFHQRSDLEIMAKSVSKDAKPKEPRHLSAYIINPTKLIKWETAVTEAESLSEFPKDKRIKKFFEMVSPKKKSKKRVHTSPASSTSSGKITKKVKSKKKLVKTKKNYDSDFLVKDEIKNENDDDDDDDKRRKIIKKRKSSIVSEDSFTDSEKLENAVKEERDTPSPVQLSSLRNRRYNLFKGISRDRVCQICGKNNNVYKCKGQCYGQYHIECDRKQRLRLPAPCDDKTDFETLIGENIVGKPITNDNTISTEIASSIVENILTNVFDKVLPSTNDTRVSLSISEQIDLKMQEVMKNVVETNYQDSATDDSSGSDSESKTTSQNSELSGRSSSQIGETFDETELSTQKQSKNTKKVVIKHVTADGVLDIIQEEAEPEEDHSNFKCTYCSTGYKPPCFICNKEKTKSGDVKKHKCMTAQCGKYYHAECLKDWPQTKWYLSTKRKELDNENLSCPYHNCHTCISDDPRGPLSRMGHEKLAKCIRCPTTYHTKNHCIPAGTEILSNYQIICPKHLIANYVEQSEQNVKDKKAVPKKYMHHVNASWCFICSMGGSLICCETCPSSFHVECLKMTPPEGKYICEECESGRLPLYDEIVWVKLGSYRWWPAQILFPIEIPENVRNIAHNKGEFVVRFFGSHDHYWVNRGRVFLFQEGDTGHASTKKTAADRLFVKAIEEATKAHQIFVDERANKMADSKNSMKPPSYIKIKVNKPVGDVRNTDADTSNTTPCDCDPNWDEPCGPDSDCLNRILLTECNPMVCAAGNRCCNQAFQNRDYAQVEPFKTSARGWGLRTLAPIKKGTFVIEYVGEVINETEYMRRMRRKHEQKDENYYFLTIDKDRMIDAGPKGNVARFMNHSCSPNCETQKWTVNGDTKVGLFAIQDIPEGAELTFNYNLECIGEEKKECRCGAPNCSGFIGVKAKQDELSKKKKGKKASKKKVPVPETKDFEVISCFVCGKTNAIQQCDRDNCNKFYHLECVNLETLQEGKWFCPWHSCNTCTKRTTRCCFMCTNSFCPIHSEGNIRYDRIKGFVCKEHDKPEFNALNLESSADASKLKKKKPKSIAEQDLEEILKYDKTSPKSKNKTNKNDKPGDEKKKKKAYNEKCLDNLKQYKDKLQLMKLIRLENEEKKTKELDKEKHENIPTSNETELPLKTNGLHPEITIEKVEIKEPLTQNNNLSIKKRKSRLNKTSDSDEDEEEEDNLPLSKRFKLDEKVQNSTETPKTEKKNESTSPNEIKDLKQEMDKILNKVLEENERKVKEKMDKTPKDVQETKEKLNETTNQTSKNETKEIKEVKETNKEAKKTNEKVDRRSRETLKGTEKTKEKLDNTPKSAKPSNDKVDKTPKEAKTIHEKLDKTPKETKTTNEKLDKTPKETKQTNEKLDKTLRKTKQLSEKMEITLVKTKQTNEKIDKTKENIKQTKEKLNKTPKEAKKINENLDKTPKEAKKPNENLDKTLKEEKKTNESLVKTPKEAKKTNESLDKTPKETKKTNENLDKTLKEEKKTNENLDKTPKEAKKTNESIDKTPKEAKKTNEKVDKTSKEAKKTNESLDKTTKEAKKTNENLDKTTKEAKKTNENLDKTPKEAKKTNEILDKTTKEAKKTNENLDKTPKEAKKTNENLDKTPKDAKKTNEKVDKTPKENLNKTSEKSKQTSPSSDTLIKRPRGRPRKFSKDTSSPENKSKQDESESLNSSLDCTSQSQSSEYDSEYTTDDSIYENSKPLEIDLECDAEEAIARSVIDKETLNVISITAEKPNQVKNEVKRMKLISPRPGIRKSLRITDPFDTSASNVSNVSNSELEISIELNTSQELEQHLGLPKLEEKRGPGRPKSAMKKKLVAVRKSNRIISSNSEMTIEIIEPIEVHDESIEDSSSSAPETETNTSTSENSLKRKRGRPKKVFIGPPPPPTPKRPLGRPKKIKLLEDSPPKQNTDDAIITEKYKIKLNTKTETKPPKTFDSHINEIKLTTNVPERHLRVMLRKSDIETKVENKFLKMQNDIERDLPIRKRSKLRYETHL